MPKPAGYDAALSLKASAYLATPTHRKPRVVIEHITRLTATPGQIGDYAVRDSTGRPMENVLLGEWHLTFWSDHAVRELRIVDIV